MISNKNFIKYKVLDLVEQYNFNIDFVFIRLHLRYEFICTTTIFKDGWISQPSLKIDFQRRWT